MAPKQTQNPTFHILDAAKTQPYVAALRSVRPELAAMAEIDVRPAVDEVVALLHAQLERVEAAVRRAEALAHRVLASRPSIDSLTDEQLRDRAYTLLTLAIEEERKTCEAPERSGVFAITDLVGAYLADQAQLPRCA